MDEEPKTKTQNLYFISESMHELKSKIRETDDRIRELEGKTIENGVHHNNTHEKLDSILGLCGKTDSRLRIVEDTILEHKTKIKMIGGISGILGGVVAAIAKFFFDTWNKNSS